MVCTCNIIYKYLIYDNFIFFSIPEIKLITNNDLYFLYYLILEP